MAATRSRERWALISRESMQTPRYIMDWLGARMLFRLFTHSPRDSKWISSESIWLSSVSRDWAKLSQSSRSSRFPGANLRQDLFQRYHPERTFAKRSVDGSEIQNWAEPPIPLGYHEVEAVKTALQLVRWDSLYCSFLEQTANLLPQSLGISRRC